MPTLNIGKVRIHANLNVKRTTQVKGLNNKLNGKHFPMWDFDETEFENVYSSLEEVGKQYLLPEIMIFESSPKHYHAFSFAPMEWTTLLHLMIDTPHVDQIFLSIGIARGFFTLRITERNGSAPFLISRIESPIKCPIPKAEQLEFIKYQTRAK